MENQQNPVNIGYRIIRPPPTPVEAQNQVVAENQDDNVMRIKLRIPRPPEFYRVIFNINDCEGPLVLPPLPHGHTFVVTSSLIQMLTTRGLFLGLPSEDPNSHIDKLRFLCKNCMGKQDVDMNIIGLRVFPL